MRNARGGCTTLLISPIRLALDAICIDSGWPEPHSLIYHQQHQDTEQTVLLPALGRTTVCARFFAERQSVMSSSDNSYTCLLARRSIEVPSVWVWVNSSEHSNQSISISEMASQRGTRSTED
ncbi:hypothetical protein B5807_12156 [Epicoccum nigrum]|uniref:Ig-like domain-containing protein n=1 Tax=Epicoccum nigrum TaxID=105696 RepID=A0A1Y2LI88_EPING|nr:hypothetical protein B5807_12156 [Epicoccum nigrum]